MVGWHHGHNGHGFGKTLGVGDGQGNLVCCGSWRHKELDMTEPLTEGIILEYVCLNQATANISEVHCVPVPHPQPLPAMLFQPSPFFIFF